MNRMQRTLHLQMASQEATSKLRAMRAAEPYRNGSDTELLHLGGEPAKLFLLCGDRFQSARCFKSGDLSVHLIRVSGSPVAMASCMVGDHHWMLAKDSMALRVAPRAFVLALPGFLFGLAFSGACSGEEVDKLEGMFKRFCAYHDLVTRGDPKLAGRNRPESDQSEPNSETDHLWSRAYSRMEKLIACSTKKVVALSAGTSAAVPGKLACDIEFIARKIHRAVRTSAVVKLVSRALLSGALSPTNHLHDVSVPPSLPARRSTDGLYALPSMWAFADLLDAMETVGFCLALPLPLPRAAGLRRISTPDGQDGCWYFNQEGLALLLELVNAYSGVSSRVKRARLAVVEEEVDGKGSSSGARDHDPFSPPNSFGARTESALRGALAT